MAAMGKYRATNIKLRTVEAAARVGAIALRTLFRLFSLFPQQRKIVLMSRQGPRPLDFRLLEPALRRCFPNYELIWACVPKSGKLSASLTVAQTWHVATARFCVADGYVPAVCICEGLHRAICVQLWHALGAVKKFGHQSVDTPAGHASGVARALRMHQGYNYIVAGFPGAEHAYQEAFSCSGDAVACWGLPRIDYVLERQHAMEENPAALDLPSTLALLRDIRLRGRKVVLYAPTFRKNAQVKSDWLEWSVRALRNTLPDPEIMLVIARHPLQISAGLRRINASLVYLNGVSAIDALCCVDAVVTDYSAIAFESWLAGKSVYFYVPDIDEYRLSPGLNIDPLEEFPDVAFKHVGDVAHVISADLCARRDGGAFGDRQAQAAGETQIAEELHATSSFDVFMRAYAAGFETNCARRIAERLSRIAHERGWNDERREARENPTGFEEDDYAGCGA